MPLDQTWGVRAKRPRSVVAARAAARTPLAAYQLVAPTLPGHAAYSHLSAARIWDLPWELPWSAQETIHVTRKSDTSRIRRRGFADHEGLELRQVCQRHGVPVTGVADTWADLAALPGITIAQLVVVGDAILCWRSGRPPELLADEVRRRPGRAGVAALREALVLVRTRSASPMESLMRLGFGRAGLPEPELNADVLSPEGEWLARADFLWRTFRVLGEFDGVHHVDPEQFRRDARRRRRLEDHGWTYLQFTATTLYDGREWEESVARLRQLLS